MVWKEGILPVPLCQLQGYFGGCYLGKEWASGLWKGRKEGRAKNTETRLKPRLFILRAYPPSSGEESLSSVSPGVQSQEPFQTG